MNFSLEMKSLQIFLGKFSGFNPPVVWYNGIGFMVKSITSL